MDSLLPPGEELMFTFSILDVSELGVVVVLVVGAFVITLVVGIEVLVEVEVVVEVGLVVVVVVVVAVVVVTSVWIQRKVSSIAIHSGQVCLHSANCLILHWQPQANLITLPVITTAHI